MDVSINAPLKKGKERLGVYWFEGNGSTVQSLKEGQGVCMNSDYGTATAVDARRSNHVELPEDANDLFFVGVLARDYSIPIDGTMVEVLEPDSVCTILLGIGVSTVVGVTKLVCQQTTGLWVADTVESGKGTAYALQTITGGAAVLPCLAALEQGPQSGLEAD
jgi:hypothetical protein